MARLLSRLGWLSLLLLLLYVQSLEFREITGGCPFTGGMLAFLVAVFGVATVVFLLCAALLSALRIFRD